MTQYHYTMTIIKNRQEIKEDGSLGNPIQIAAWTKPYNGGKTKKSVTTTKNLTAQQVETEYI